MVGPTTPLVVAYAVPRLLVYFTESAKYASSAVIRLRRSDFIEARYAFSFVFANFGIAIAAKMPMITTTIRSSISVKPLRFIWTNLPCKDLRHGRHVYSAVTGGRNRAFDGGRVRKYLSINWLRSQVRIRRPPQKREKLGLFASRHARRNNAVIHCRYVRYHVSSHPRQQRVRHR